MFAPLGVAYIMSLLASLLVSLTVTPVLASFLLPNARILEEKQDPFVLRWLKRLFERVLRVTLRHAYAMLGVVRVLVSMSVLCIFWMGGEFLPPFNEGTFTINMQTEPGTSLEESNRVAGRAESMLLEVPEVMCVSRRTGRAELDEHAEGVNSSEIDVRLREHKLANPAGYTRSCGVYRLHIFGATKCWAGREIWFWLTSATKSRAFPPFASISVSRSRIGWITLCPACVHRSPSKCLELTCRNFAMPRRIFRRA